MACVHESWALTEDSARRWFSLPGWTQQQSVLLLLEADPVLIERERKAVEDKLGELEGKLFHLSWRLSLNEYASLEAQLIDAITNVFEAKSGAVERSTDHLFLVAAVESAVKMDRITGGQSSGLRHLNDNHNF